MTHVHLPLPLWQLSARRPLGAFFFAFVLATLLGALTLFGCQGCGAHGLPTTPREQARATALVLAEGVVRARQVCAEIVERDGNLPLGEKCLAQYITARDLLLIAGGAVDAWDEGRKGETACATVRGAEAASLLADTLSDAGGKVPPALVDGLTLYRSLMAGSCSDGGAS